MRIPDKWFLVAAALWCCCSGIAAGARDRVPVHLWRLDCGELRVDDLNDYSDSGAYRGKSMQFVVSCYLIQHGQSYMLWDTGLPVSDLGAAVSGPDARDETLAITIVTQLQTLGVMPDQITEIGISHYHLDHTGQAESFPQARLFIGEADLEVLRRPESAHRARPLLHWLDTGGSLDAVDGDRDIYGDGSVVMLNLPGHTPGHHGLLVRLAKTGTVLLSGDAVHFRENYESRDMPAQNTSRAESLASIDRLRSLVVHLSAMLIIQHDPRDVSKLPKFPAAAY